MKNKIFSLMIITFGITGCNAQNITQINGIRNGMITHDKIQEIPQVAPASTTGEMIKKYKYSNGDTFTSKSDIMIKFTNTPNIKYIENKYHLKLIRKMSSGDYLFKNLKGNTLDIINNINQDKSLKLQRISPNKILNIKIM